MIQYPKKFVRCECGEEYWLDPELMAKDHVIYESFICPQCNKLVSDSPSPTWLETTNKKHN